jgi:hypothetical protein
LAPAHPTHTHHCMPATTTRAHPTAAAAAAGGGGGDIYLYMDGAACNGSIAKCNARCSPSPPLVSPPHPSRGAQKTVPTQKKTQSGRPGTWDNASCHPWTTLCASKALRAVADPSSPPARYQQPSTPLSTCTGTRTQPNHINTNSRPHTQRLHRRVRQHPHAPLQRPQYSKTHAALQKPGSSPAAIPAAAAAPARCTPLMTFCAALSTPRPGLRKGGA